MRRYRIRFTRGVLEDLERVTLFLVESSPDRAPEAEPALHDAVEVLKRLPWVGRIAREQNDRTLRELLVPLGATGYVLLYRVGPGHRVTLLAARHQLEERFH